MSTFAELYDDFRDTILAYEEKPTATELQFMRYATRGAQIFQRRTHYIESLMQLQYNQQTGNYPLNIGVLAIISVTGPNGGEYALMEQPQHMRHWENLGAGVDFMRAPEKYFLSNPDGYGTVYYWQNALWFPQNFQGTPPSTITIHFIPDYPAFTARANVTWWQAWFPINQNFLNLFTTTGFPAELVPYEQAFVDYAVARYLRNRAVQMFIYYEKKFEEEVQRGIEEKPDYLRSRRLNYWMAPYS